MEKNIKGVRRRRATKVLKDSDKVEVDATKSLVKKLEA